MNEIEEIRAGDCVRLISIPTEVLEPPEVPWDEKIREIYEYSLGHAFHVDYIDNDMEGG